MRKALAEAIGTFGLVFTGCGAALVGGARLGDAGVALAFGMALTAMTFTGLLPEVMDGPVGEGRDQYRCHP